MSRLRAQGLSVGYHDRPVLTGLDIEIPDHQVTTVIGPNGCGKSTLLRTLARLLPTRAGTVYLDERDIDHVKPRQVARTLSILPQNPVAPQGLTVADLVGRGRHPYQRWFQQASSADESAVREAMTLTNTLDLADRPIDALSGGQRQRVWIALTLAQGTDLILLDEPTTFLDLAHSVDVLELVTTLRNEHGKTVVMVLHDLNLAARYSDSLFVMKQGQIITHGAPESVLDAELLADVFGLRAHVMTDPVSGGPLIVPLGGRVA